MPHRLLVALFVTTALLGGAFAQEAAKEAEDIGAVSPEELLGADPQAALGEAQAAYATEKYEDAAWAYIRALRLKPGDSTALYNLACCYGLLGMEKQAVAFLDASWQAGFTDLGHIRGDGDFAKVRESDAFQALLERLAKDAEEQKKRAGKLLPVFHRTLADVRVIAPETNEPWKRFPLVIGLHGLGGTAESFAGLFEKRGIETGFIYCVPQAPYAFPPENPSGWSWTRWWGEFPKSALFDATAGSRDYVLDVLEAVMREYPVDRRKVFLLGFSQGAGMAASLGVRHPEKFAGVIPIGGWLDAGEFGKLDGERVGQYGNFLVCHSKGDRVVEFDRAKEAIVFLTDHQVPHRLLEYEGGHTIPKGLAEQIVEWIKATK